MIVSKDGMGCQLCTRYRGGRTCEAFSDQIPDAIWSGRNPHLDAFPGDGGLRRVSRDEQPGTPTGTPKENEIFEKLRSARGES